MDKKEKKLKLDNLYLSIERLENSLLVQKSNKRASETTKWVLARLYKLVEEIKQK